MKQHNSTLLKILMLFQVAVFFVSLYGIIEIGFAKSMTITDALGMDKLGFADGLVHGYYFAIAWIASFFFDISVYALNSTPAYDKGFGMGIILIFFAGSLNRIAGKRG